MNILRNIAAVIVGLVVGSIANMALVLAGNQLLPLSSTDMADYRLLEPKHFIFPFLAHAVGTLVGAAVAHVIAATKRKAMSLVIGVLFLAGGIAACFMIPAPVWFIALDLLLAYLPMALIGAHLGGKLRKEAV